MTILDAARHANQTRVPYGSSCCEDWLKVIPEMHHPGIAASAGQACPVWLLCHATCEVWCDGMNIVGVTAHDCQKHAFQFLAFCHKTVLVPKCT